MIRAELKTEGLRAFERFVDRLLLKVADTQGLMERIARYGVSSTVRRIKEGVPPPNAPLTREWKKGKEAIPLVDNSRLIGSITHRAGRHFAAWGTNVEYARIHQLGGEIKPKRARKLAIPAGWHTRRLMRKYGETPEKCLEGLKRAGWKIWFTDGAIMGEPPSKNKKSSDWRTYRNYRRELKKKIEKGEAKDHKGMILFIRKESVTIPARPFLRIDDQDKREILEIVSRWVRDRR